MVIFLGGETNRPSFKKLKLWSEALQRNSNKEEKASWRFLQILNSANFRLHL